MEEGPQVTTLACLTHAQEAGVLALTQLVGVEWGDETLLRAAEARVLAATMNPYQDLALDQVRQHLMRSHA
jgi:hypothetical protein